MCCAVNAENSTASTGTTMMEQQQQKQHITQMQPLTQPYMTALGMTNVQIQYPPSSNCSVQQANISVYNSPHVHHQQQAVYQSQQQVD
jgi:hypothetical protein